MAARMIWTLLLAYHCTYVQLSFSAPSSTGALHLKQEHTFPSVVDAQGNHLSNDLTTVQLNNSRTTYIKFDAFGNTFMLHLNQYNGFINSEDDPVIEYMSANSSSHHQTPVQRDCHYVGYVTSVKDPIDREEVAMDDNRQWASISNCKGLRGVVATLSGYMFIEPVMSHDVTDGPRLHVVYKSTTTSSQASLEANSQNRLKRSILVSGVTIETVLVADKSMLERYGHQDLEAYLHSVMGVVHHLYRDPSIGHSINIALVRTVILEEEISSLASNGYRMLDDVCTWKDSLKGSGPRFDMVVMVTRKHMCESNGRNCGTLGMADISSVCSGGRSCNVNMDTGLSTAFTIAHELGHNIGLRHDGDPLTQCLSNPRYLMAPTFAESINPHMWSSCSRQQLANILSDKNKVSCLLDKPAAGSPSYQFAGSPIQYGMEYTPTEQCRLQTGNNNTKHCPGKEDECRYLWCQPSDESSNCDHQHSPPAPGTVCTLISGKEGVCYQGACQEYSSVSEPRDGGWNQWEEWSECSRSCGMGVQYSDRYCNSPIPANGGLWCSGPRRRHRVCNHDNCPNSSLSYRDSRCQQHPPNTQYSGWHSATLAIIQYQQLDMCYSHCTTASRGNVIYSNMYHLNDGAPCHTGQSRGICVEGRCEAVSCEGKLGVEAYRDKCGVWCGRGDSCLRVSGLFDNITHPGSYYYYEAVYLPQGSTNIRIEELALSTNNYIVIDGEKSKVEKFNLYVRQDGISKLFFADSAWVYGRIHNESEYFSTTGPINEGVVSYVLANSAYNGVRYTFSVPKSKLADLRHDVYYWWAGVWDVCSVECGEGTQIRPVQCLTLSLNKTEQVIVDTIFCDPHSKPIIEETCFTEECVYEWTLEDWTQCNTTCGNGHQTRESDCEWTRRNGLKEIVNSSLCELATRPALTRECVVECVYEWKVTAWSDCDAVCSNGQQTRSVECSLINADGSTVAVEDSFCFSDNTVTAGISEVKPISTRVCVQPDCVYLWNPSVWSECNRECGLGSQHRLVTCVWDKGPSLGRELVNHTYCDPNNKPSLTQSCYKEDCVYVWSTGQWSSCNTTVCGDGSQQRTVNCQWLRNNGEKMTVADSYCYTIQPPSTQPCSVECVYKWSTSSWGSCTGLCGEGVAKRTVVCEWLKTDELRETVSDEHCVSITKPHPSRSCDLPKCRYRWLTKDWSICDVECGEGWRRRDVVCMWEDILVSEGYIVGAERAVVEDVMCGEEGLKPEHLLKCHAPHTCPQWHTTDWSECLVCGVMSEQTRSVQCRAHNGTIVDHTHCPSELYPLLSQSCYHECQPCTDSWDRCPSLHKDFCNNPNIQTLCCHTCS